jgi:Bacterial regulatory helix-turn-helix protein, lysR family
MSGSDTKYLRAAIVPMEELNFSCAATKLNIGRAALSKEIGHLHDQLGYELLVRQGRNITATAAREVYVTHHTARRQVGLKIPISNPNVSLTCFRMPGSSTRCFVKCRLAAIPSGFAQKLKG